MKLAVASLALLLTLASAMPKSNDEYEKLVARDCDTPCYQDCASYCPIHPPGAGIGCSIACLDICGCT